jgi:hypothetical protein
MAWKTFLKNYSAGQQATVFADFCAFAVTAGWTLHDDVLASKKVYKSAGESGTEIMGYLQLDYDATYIYFRTFTYWDAATHTGYGQSYYHATNANGAKIANTAGVKRFYGNKDVLAYYTLDAYYYLSFTGHLVAENPVYQHPVATLTGDVVAGASVVVPVDSTVGFPLNSTMVIIDPATGMRQGALITAINPGVSLTISVLANNYTTGSKIGWCPSIFGHAGETQLSNAYIMMLAGKNSSGSGMNPGTVCGITNLPNIPAYNSPSGVSLYSLSLVQFQLSQDDLVVGMLPSPVRATDRVRNSIIAVRDDNQFTVYTATSGSSNTLADTVKSWTVNEFKGKMLVLVGGTGLDQSRVILSNTATTITVRDDWVTAPALGTNYVIADRSYLSAVPIYFAFMENEE